ncbi:hypothetical protein V6N13_074081 [Hibiscus sabdariffa]
MWIMSWNVCGIGSVAKQRGGQDVLRHHRCDMVLLQEFKLEELLEFLIANTCPSDSFDYAFSSSVGASSVDFCYLGYVLFQDCIFGSVSQFCRNLWVVDFGTT